MSLAAGLTVFSCRGNVPDSIVIQLMCSVQHANGISPLIWWALSVHDGNIQCYAPRFHVFGHCMPLMLNVIYLFTIITRSNIVRYYINNYRNWRWISIRCWIHKIPLTGELWRIFCEYLWNNWPRYNGTALYVRKWPNLIHWLVKSHNIHLLRYHIIDRNRLMRLTHQGLLQHQCTAMPVI